MRVLLVEDHDVVARGVCTILEPFVTRVEVLRTAAGLVDEYLTRQPDVVLLDLNVPPDGNAISVIPLIKEAAPESKIVCFSAAHELGAVRAALEAGAAGFISKVADAQEISALLQLALEGEIVLDRRTTSRFVTAASSAAVLSSRETNVLHLASIGKTNVEISAELHISKTAVTDALSSCFRKLKAEDRTSAVRIALERGLIASAPLLT
jgi:DNA-binding NarL/FixJ family response regulator